jgi:hypothetical protein
MMARKRLNDNPNFSSLRFTDAWIEVGILTDEVFNELNEEFLKGDDSNSEHYRWKAFRDFMSSNKVIEAKTFARLYQLGKNDADYFMGRAMIFDIVKRSDCPLELLEMVSNDEDAILAKHAIKHKSIRAAG